MTSRIFTSVLIHCSPLCPRGGEGGNGLVGGWLAGDIGGCCETTSHNCMGTEDGRSRHH